MNLFNSQLKKINNEVNFLDVLVLKTTESLRTKVYLKKQQHTNSCKLYHNNKLFTGTVSKCTSTKKNYPKELVHKLLNKNKDRKKHNEEDDTDKKVYM